MRARWCWLHIVPVLMLVMLLCIATVMRDKSTSAAAQPADVAPELTGPSSPRTAPRLIVSTAIGNPAVTEDYVFWVDMRNDQPALYGYDLNTSREFLIRRAEETYHLRGLTTNGTIVAWLDYGQSTQGFVRVEAYLIAEQRVVTLVERLPAHWFITDLNLVDGMLYYSDMRQGSTRIYRYNLATHQEEQVRERGSGPVVADGTLLWIEGVWRGKYVPPHMSLHMQPLQRPQEARVLDTGNTGLSGYGVDGDKVVWAFYSFAGQDQVHVYDITAGITTTLPFTNVVHPIIYSDTVAWTQMGDRRVNRRFEYSIMSYNLATHTLATLVATETAQLQPIKMLDEHGFVFKVNSFSAQGGQSLYIIPPGHQAHGLPRLTCHGRPGSAQLAAVNGQVWRDGPFLYEGAVVDRPDPATCWTVNGVHFFLPQTAINGNTFHDGTFENTGADREKWLRKAQEELHAKTIRIFIDFPNKDGNGPTSYRTIYRFAEEVGGRGMRIGLVLHNSGDFDMTAARKDWLKGLLRYLKGGNGNPSNVDLSPVIAYINADNEINNHPSGRPGGNPACEGGEGARDCYKQSQNYVNQANEWVHQFRLAMQEEGSRILLTVGMANDMTGNREDLGVSNFFRKGGLSGSYTLESEVDFLSPHHYGESAEDIINKFRAVPYYGPVVLEEHGHPTDPEPAFTEGEPACRTDPFSAGCERSAPFYVQSQVNSIQRGNYAGSSVFMLTDMKAKNSVGCTAREQRYDYFTGLFTIDDNYPCDGTITRGDGSLKATGTLVAAHYNTPYACRLNLVFLPVVNGPPACLKFNPPAKSAVCPGNDVPGCLPEPFRAYWEANGGLAVFGYPISDVDDEDTVYDDRCLPVWTGRTLWFERDRLEDHGNDGVMAGRLGVELLRARGTPWQSFPQVDSAPPGCQYFPETRHSLCEPFLSHWQQQGGLARFGYPITEPFITTITIDNGTWQGTVQYFERRRMEDHTPDGNGILLGLLGRELLDRFTGAMDAEYREAVRNHEPVLAPAPAALPAAPPIVYP